MWAQFHAHSDDRDSQNSGSRSGWQHIGRLGHKDNTDFGEKSVQATRTCGNSTRPRPRSGEASGVVAPGQVLDQVVWTNLIQYADAAE
jgi:hypothetical protein